MQHFECGFPNEQNPDPISADPYTGTKGNCKKRPPPKTRYPVDHITCIKRPRKSLSETTVDSSTSNISDHDLPDALCEDLNKDNSTQTSPKKVPKNLQNGLTHPTLIKCESCGHYNRPTKTDLKLIAKNNFIQTIQHDDSTCFHYTGIPKVALLLQVFCWLEPLASKVKLWDGNRKFTTAGRSAARKRKALTTFEEFCLTLVRIRRGFDVVHLSYLFGISKSHVCRILTSWINFLAKCLRPLIKWPSKDIVIANLPQSFKCFPRTRVIIDCT